MLTGHTFLLQQQLMMGLQVKQQTFTIDVTSLPENGAGFRVYKTTANGSDFFGNSIELTLGSNSFTVGAVGFDRAIGFQFSNGSVEFDALSLNGISDCIIPLPPPTSSFISDCDDFVSGPSAALCSCSNYCC